MWNEAPTSENSSTVKPPTNDFFVNCVNQDEPPSLDLDEYVGEGWEDEAVSVWWNEDRHWELVVGDNTEDEERESWRIRERMKTLSVALVLCLNIGVDPPDVVKPNPCARLECWIDTMSMSGAKAIECVGVALQKQYERWQQRARYKQSLDPTVDDVKKLCQSLRRNAKEERVLFHYNGHGVPKPTQNGEMWVFNRNYTQYIPLSVYDLESWLGTPSVYLYDCNSAGLILQRQCYPSSSNDNTNNNSSINNPGAPSNNNNNNNSSNSNNPQQRQSTTPPSDAATATTNPAPKDGGSRLFRESIGLAACSEGEVLPMIPEVPADLFTSCLTTPIKTAILAHILNHKLTDKFPAKIWEKLPGKFNERKSLLGELNWIFTAITDTIAWNALPRELFQKLFRQDLLVASMFRNFLLAERVMACYNCRPVSYPVLPATLEHPLWDSWDLALDSLLAPLKLREDGSAVSIEHMEHVPCHFFANQLKAVEVWLRYGHESRRPPEQLPVVLQKDLVKEDGHKFFVDILADKSVDRKQQMIPAFILTALMDNFSGAQEKLREYKYMDVCISFLWRNAENEWTEDEGMVQMWILIGLGRLWSNYSEARWLGIRNKCQDTVTGYLHHPLPEVRAAAAFALGTLLANPAHDNEHATKVEQTTVQQVVKASGSEGSILARKEIAVALHAYLLDFSADFTSLINRLLGEQKKLNERGGSNKFDKFGGSPMELIRFDAMTGLLANHPNAANHHHPHHETSKAQSLMMKSRTAILRVNSMAGSPLSRTSSQDNVVGGGLATTSRTHSPSPGPSSGSSMVIDHRKYDEAFAVQFHILDSRVTRTPNENVWLAFLKFYWDPSPAVREMAGKVLRHVFDLAEPLFQRQQQLEREMGQGMGKNTGILSASRLRQQTPPSTDAAVSPPKAVTAQTHPTFQVGSPGSLTSTTPVPPTTANPKLNKSPTFHLPSQQSDASLINSSRSVVASNSATMKVDIETPLISTDFVNWCTKRLRDPLLNGGAQARLGMTEVQLTPAGDQAKTSGCHLSDSAAMNLQRLNSVSRDQRESILRKSTRLESQKFGHKLDERPGDIVFSPLFSNLFLINSSIVEMWDWQTGKRVFRYQNSLISSERGHWIDIVNPLTHCLVSTGTNKGVVRLWDLGLMSTDASDILHSDHHHDSNNTRLSGSVINPRLVAGFNILAEENESSKASGGGGMMRTSSRHSPSIFTSHQHVQYSWEQAAGFLIASGGEQHRFIRLWDVTRERSVQDMPVSGLSSGGYVTSLSSDIAGSKLISAGCSDGSVRLFDRRLGGSEKANVTTFKEFQYPISQVMLEPQEIDHKGRIVATNSIGEGHLRVWEPRMYQEPVIRSKVSDGPIKAMSVHWRGQQIAVAHDSGPSSSHSSSPAISIINFKGKSTNSIRYQEGNMGQSIGSVSSLKFHPFTINLASASSSNAHDHFLSVHGLNG